MHSAFRGLASGVGALLLASAALAAPPRSSAGEVGSALATSRVRPVIGTKGMVVSDDARASEWGAEILRRGGNAIDAAVATAFMLAVSRPYYASLGGGGFLVYCPAPRKGPSGPLKQACTSIDYREKAPARASRDMYLRGGKGDTDLSQNGALASGVPGVTAGLLLALERFGTKSRRDVLSEPIRVARDGVALTGLGEEAAQERWPDLSPAARAIIGCGKAPCPAGTIFRQTDLARVLEEISRRGAQGFYRGWVAQKISSGLRAEGGILSLRDLAAYEPSVRKPVHGDFDGYELVSMAPPSSGGVLLLQMAGYLARYAKGNPGFAESFGAASSIHAMAHAMALAFSDRARYLGDSDFVHVPLATLLAPDYLERRWKSFDPSRARIPSGPGSLGREGSNTTHFCVIDARGNAVAITTTINDYYGSGFVPRGTGVFMNDEMDDFSIQPGVPNLFGLVGGQANAIAPGKRPLSSMSPSILRDADGNIRIVIGGAGGSKIPTAVFDVLVDRLYFGMSLPDAMSAPRIHEQWKPDKLVLERYGFSPDVRAKLRAMGYEIQQIPAAAKLHALERFPNGRVWGVADPRGEGAAVAQ